MSRNHRRLAFSHAGTIRWTFLLLCSGSVAGCSKSPTSSLPAGVTEGCALAECHGRVEQIHYGGPSLRCVDCHLGDPKATTKESAHVTVDISFNPSTPGSAFIDSPSMAELDAIDLDVIQFLNPADYRVAMRTCGEAGIGGASCHPTIVENSLLLNRATLAGQLAGGGFIAGLQDRRPRFGSLPTQDPQVPAQLPKGSIGTLEALPAVVPAGVTDATARGYFPVLEQLCLECHLNRDGPRIPGRYYSSGCNGCHMVTANDARAATADITQDREELGHVLTHRFTNLVPDSQCAHCHISHLGRSLLAQGVRERSEPEGDALIGGVNRGVEDPEAHEPWGRENYVRHQGRLEIYGKPYPYFIVDEDSRNDIDETPPDIHTERGLGCIDCHNIREAHGDRQMLVRMDREIDVRCESCHGRPGELGDLRSDAGLAFNRSTTAVGSTGDNLPVFQVDRSGAVLQYGRFTRALHPVTQITRRTDPGSATFNPRTRMGCELHAGGASTKRALKLAVNALATSDPMAVAATFPGLTSGFTFDVSGTERDGRLECFTCHNAWTVNCYGCHIVRDDRESYTSPLDGETRLGRVSTYGQSVMADALALGFNTRGRISPMVGTSIFFTHIDADGVRIVDAQALTTGDGIGGDGNVHNPAHHHTTRRLPRDCDGCHPSVTGSHDEAALLTAVGFGSGRFTFTDGDGAVHRLDRLVSADYDGDGVVDDPVLAGLPTRVASVQPLVTSTHDTILDSGAAPPPGPLDLEAINLMLGSRVVPQRGGP